MINISIIKKWKRWSIPSKLTAIGTMVTIVGVILSVIFFIAPNWKQKYNISDLEVKMRITYGGFFRIRVINQGKTIAKGCNIKIGSSAFGAPFEDIIIQEGFPDLIQGADWVYDIDIFGERKKHSGNNIPRCAIIGYIAITCNNFLNPKAWTFYIPEENKMNDFNVDNILLIPFKYTSEDPSFTISKIWREYKYGKTKE